jgi:uncharacterized protein YigE (DUF2233 family)
MKNIVLLVLAFSACSYGQQKQDVIVKICTPEKISIYWKDNSGAPYKTFERLFQQNNKLLYAMNAGMFGPEADARPVGLFIQDGVKLRKLKITSSDKYNFGMQPQAVFLITRQHKAAVVTVSDYQKMNEGNIWLATQSAPMVVINGSINPKLTTSSSAYVRNGIGILPDEKVLMVCTKHPVTFRQFAQLFINYKCTAAMYFDGAIANLLSRDEAKQDFYKSYGTFIGVSK